MTTGSSHSLETTIFISIPLLPGQLSAPSVSNRGVVDMWIQQRTSAHNTYLVSYVMITSAIMTVPNCGMVAVPIARVNAHFYFNLSDHYLSDHYLSDHYLSDHYLSDHYLSDHYLSDHYLSDHYLSDHYLSDHYLSDHYLSDHWTSVA